MKATELLHNLGQSLWLDHITRDLLETGMLRRYMDQYSVTGLTSNAAIFERAVRNGPAYDRAICEAIGSGVSAEALFFHLALEDITRAADLFRAIHESTHMVDGWVSLDLPSFAASDAHSMVRVAKELFARARRPNLLIGIPGTSQGLAAVEEAIFAGVPVHVTLLFSREQYLCASEAFLRGIERRLEAGLNPNVGSVASVFASRWDAAVTGRAPASLRNRLGIAVAKRTYRAARALLASPQWQLLYRAGARPPRILWASAAAMDPAYSDILYAKELAAPFTVNAMAETTLRALARHDQLSSVLPADGGDCDEVLWQFENAGVHIEALAVQLQEDAARSADQSWHALLSAIASKCSVLRKAS